MINAKTGREGSFSPMETNQPSPTTPVKSKEDKQEETGHKKDSWGQHERTRQLRNSLEKDNETSGKLGGAIKWRMVDDAVDPCKSAGNIVKDKTKTSQEKHQKDEAESTKKDKGGETVYASIWDPPRKQNLSKEGCRPNENPKLKASSTATSKTTPSSAKEAEPKTSGSNTQKTTESKIGTEETWQEVRYKKSLRKESKQQPGKPEENPKAGKPQQDRGRERTKKPNANQKSKNKSTANLTNEKDILMAKTDEKKLQTKAQGQKADQISLQERVNIAVATAASREDRRSQSASRQAYLTPEGTVVRNLQRSSSRGGKVKDKTASKSQGECEGLGLRQNKLHKPDKADSSNQPRGLTGKQKQ